MINNKFLLENDEQAIVDIVDSFVWDLHAEFDHTGKPFDKTINDLHDDIDYNLSYDLKNKEYSSINADDLRFFISNIVMLEFGKSLFDSPYNYQGRVQFDVTDTVYKKVVNTVYTHFGYTDYIQ